MIGWLGKNGHSGGMLSITWLGRLSSAQKDGPNSGMGQTSAISNTPTSELECKPVSARALYFQNYYFGLSLRCVASAKCLQSAWRGKKAKMRCNAKRSELKYDQMRENPELYATKLQCRMRGKRLRNVYKSRNAPCKWLHVQFAKVEGLPAVIPSTVTCTVLLNGNKVGQVSKSNHLRGLSYAFGLHVNVHVCLFDPHHTDFCCFASRCRC